jgi:hypothetical protein
MVGAPGRAAVFAVGVALTSASMVFDQATVGLLRGDLQLRRNIAFAIGKILTLFAAATILHDQFGLGITLSWVTGIALSMALLAIRLWFDGQPVLARPDWGVLRGLGRTAMAHNWLNLALMVPFYLMPVLVTVIVSPSANAAYYVASMLATFLLIVPGHLATVLFAVVAADPKVLASKLRFSLRVSFIIGLPAMAVLILGAHTALGLFGKGYYIATVPLWLMTLGYPAYVPKVLYIAVCRASGRITHAAVVLTVCSSAEIAAAVAGGMAGGLIGLSWALLAVRYGEALFIAPPGDPRGLRPRQTPTFRVGPRLPLATAAPAVTAGIRGTAAPGAPDPRVRQSSNRRGRIPWQQHHYGVGSHRGNKYAAQRWPNGQQSVQ